MKISKIIAALSVFTLFTISTLKAAPFNSKLSSQELARLNNGEVLIRNLSSYKDLCIRQIPETEELYKGVKALKPAYTAEVIKIVPYKGNEDLRERINSALLNLSEYVNIPYFSERTQKTYKLYDAAEIKSSRKEGNKTIILAGMEMSVFGKFDAEILIQETPSYYFYRLKNLDNLVYHEKFTAVRKENMQSFITLFRDGDNWVLYSVGGVDTLKVFFLEDRVETSFMNRIKTFCNFIFTKIE